MNSMANRGESLLGRSSTTIANKDTIKVNNKDRGRKARAAHADLAIVQGWGKVGRFLMWLFY